MKRMTRLVPFLLAFMIVAASCHAAGALAPGLVGEYFFVEDLASDFPAIPAPQKPTFKRVDPHIAFPLMRGEFYGTKLSERFYVRWSGVLRAPAKGRYTLYTESDDGSRVMIHGAVVVNNYGLHAMQEEEGDVELAEGGNAILVEYIQYDGGAGIKLLWKAPGAEKVIIPKDALWHNPAEAAPDVQTAAAAFPRPALAEETIEPAASATLEEKVASVLPRAQEDLWLNIPWRRNLHSARMESQLTGKPLFLWVMNGNPMGCT
jgi:hypothetical protein